MMLDTPKCPKSYQEGYHHYLSVRETSKQQLQTIGVVTFSSPITSLSPYTQDILLHVSIDFVQQVISDHHEILI